MDDRIKKVMGAVFDIDPGTIKADTSPDTVEKWDSLRHMGMVVALEEEFQIKFNDDDIPNMLNFQIIRNAVHAEVRS